MITLSLAHALTEDPVVSLVDQLRRDGYVVIRRAAEPELIDRLNREAAERFKQTPFAEGSFYGNRTKRYGRLLARSSLAAELVQHQLIVDVIHGFLIPEYGELQLNLTQALEMHPGSIAQIPHRDDSIWDGPRPFEYSVNVMWPFTRYTRENGATNLWPGSNHHQEVMLSESESVDIEMTPGDALLYVGSILHRGGHNCSDEIRRGMIVGYCLGWLKPYENQWLAYPPSVARYFSPDLARLVGYRQDQPNLGNYEGQCPSILLRDDIPEYLAAIDNLRPDQVQMIADFRSGKLALVP